MNIWIALLSTITATSISGCVAYQIGRAHENSYWLDVRTRVFDKVRNTVTRIPPTATREAAGALMAWEAVVNGFANEDSTHVSDHWMTTIVNGKPNIFVGPSVLDFSDKSLLS